MFEEVDGYVRHRLRRLLDQRQGRTTQGMGLAHYRWPNEGFAQSGLLA